MTFVFIFVGILILAAIALLSLGKLNDTGAEKELPDSAGAQAAQLAADPASITASDIDGLRFSLAARGYRIDQVDAVLDQLSATVALQSAEIERLKAGQIPVSQNEG